MAKQNNAQPKSNNTWLWVIFAVLLVLLLMPSNVISEIKNYYHTIDETNGTITINGNENKYEISADGTITEGTITDNEDTRDVVALSGFTFKTSYSSGFLGLDTTSFKYSQEQFCEFELYPDNYARVGIFCYLPDVNGQSQITFHSDGTTSQGVPIVPTVVYLAYSLTDSGIILTNTRINNLYKGTKNTKELTGDIDKTNELLKEIYTIVDDRMYKICMNENVGFVEYFTMQLKGVLLKYQDNDEYPTGVSYKFNHDITDAITVYTCSNHKYDNKYYEEYTIGDTIKQMQLTPADVRVINPAYFHNILGDKADTFVRGGSLSINY